MAARSDAVSRPEPRSVGELADRLQRPGSVALALPRLALPSVQVAEALAALGAPAARDALVHLLGVPDGECARLDTALGVLADHALVWPDGNGSLHMAAPLKKAWDAPLGLDPPLAELLVGATSEQLRGMLAKLGVKPPGTKQQRLRCLVEHHSDPQRVTAVVAKAPAATRRLLERLAKPASGSRSGSRQSRFIMFGSPEPAAGQGAQWALDRGLLVQHRYLYEPARMPAQVALALRGPGWHAPFEPEPPKAPLQAVTSEEVEREAAVALTAFVAHAASVLSVCAARPPARLKSGGVGVRELVRIGKAAQCDEAVVRVVLETAYAAGLLARDGDLVPVTEAYDAWAEREPGERIPPLLQAWRALPLTPAQARDEEGKTQPALAGTPPCNRCVQAREGLLTAAANLPADQGLQRAPEHLGPLVAWHRPFADQLDQDETPFATVIHEAEMLGVLARGALSSIGAALLADDADELSAGVQRLLPAAATTALIGADLTAITTGPPSVGLTTLLDSVADREAGGTASVWRFSPGSVRRALDAGRSPDGIEADLTAVAAGPLPQPLSYLIADTARQHGRVRLAPAACVIHSAEPAILAEITVHRKLTKLGLRQLAPTVVVSRTSLDKTLAALRAGGYAPVAEAADGTVRIEKAAQHRASASVPSPRVSPRVARGTTGGQRPASRTKQVQEPAGGLRALAVRLRESPGTGPESVPDSGTLPDTGVGTGIRTATRTETEAVIAECTRGLFPTDVRQLAHAVDAGEAITIEYVAASGSHTVRSLSELHLDPPYLLAWCHLRDDERVFTLSRIQGVMPA